MNIIYPISFTRNSCIHCGKRNTLKFKDKYGNLTLDPIYPIQSMVCTSCNREYFIRWIEDPNKEGKMIPICCSDSLKTDFEKEIISYSKERTRVLDID